jgi:hypothetical protein
MGIHPQDTTIMAYLKSKDPQYYGKVLELRECVEEWLAYVPQTFPHYTRHTIRHSDEIVLQISKLLFREEKQNEAVIQLSAVEAYILVAAAYLHDAGMVAADREKIEILNSDDWKTWTSDHGGGAERWSNVHLFRNGDVPEDEATRNFLADLQTRFLLAEFVRRVHHLRAASVIEQYQPMLGRFAFDDPSLQRTIADVCVAHGLSAHELDDRGRYPDRRDVRGQLVNVQLMALLLRLGDLLDMSCDRACPLLLNAACPLPANSLAHWTQYQRIVSRLTAPDRIEITAECETQDEHRLLQDWCQWIVDEIANARRVMLNAHRHREWDIPVASMNEPGSSIEIRPSPSATYIPSRWTFELEPEAVLSRLIFDVYESPTDFIRELIQNALDATRCQMYADLISSGTQPPEYPTQVAQSIRDRYEIRVSLQTRQIENPLSGETEHRQVVTVDDPGIGMDREIIQRYFLQVGRSYYTTDEFKRRFGFMATSRFGVGFLSVFAVSDHVLVETLKPSSESNDGAIRLTLTGARNYLLRERGTRASSGTRIEVLLREPIGYPGLTGLIKQWCRRVEFPILVTDLYSEERIIAETQDDFCYEIPDVVDQDAKLTVRAFPTNRSGIEGELYVFAKVDSMGESWAEWDNYSRLFPNKFPRATTPKVPDELRAVHGITFRDHAIGYSSSPIAARIDYRREMRELTLSRRSNQSSSSRKEYDSDILSRWEEILNDHFDTSLRASGEASWLYKQTLSKYFDLPTYWNCLPGMVRVFANGDYKLVSLKDLQQFETIKTILSLPVAGALNKKTGTASQSPDDPNTPTVYASDIDQWSRISRLTIFDQRRATAIDWSSTGVVAFSWQIGGDDSDSLMLKPWDNRAVGLLSMVDNEKIGFDIHSTTDSIHEHVLLNSSHPLIEWLLVVSEHCSTRRYGLQKEQFIAIRDNLLYAIRYHDPEELMQYLSEWRKLPDLPPELYPAVLEITEDMLTIN